MAVAKNKPRQKSLPGLVFEILPLLLGYSNPFLSAVPPGRAFRSTTGPTFSLNRPMMAPCPCPAPFPSRILWMSEGRPSQTWRLPITVFSRAGQWANHKVGHFLPALGVGSETVNPVEECRAVAAVLPPFEVPQFLDSLLAEGKGRWKTGRRRKPTPVENQQCFRKGSFLTVQPLQAKSPGDDRGSLANAVAVEELSDGNHSAPVISNLLHYCDRTVVPDLHLRPRRNDFVPERNFLRADTLDPVGQHAAKSHFFVHELLHLV